MAYGKINVESAVSGGGGFPVQVVNYTMLYDSGDECVDITGGWIAYACSNSSGKNITKNSDSISTYSSLTTGGNNWINGIQTTNLIDLTGYSGAFSVISAVGINSNGLSAHYKITGFRHTSSVDQTSSDFNWCKQSINTPFNWTIEGPLSNSTTIKLPSNVKISHYRELSTLAKPADSLYAACGTFNGTLTLYNFAILKEDNWQEWISKAGLSTDTYTTLDAVIDDSTALTTLMNNEVAVKYMILNCTGTVMASVIQRESALNILADSAYSTKIYANEHWAKFLAMVA